MGHEYFFSFFVSSSALLWSLYDPVVVWSYQAPPPLLLPLPPKYFSLFFRFFIRNFVIFVWSCLFLSSPDTVCHHRVCRGSAGCGMRPFFAAGYGISLKLMAWCGIRCLFLGGMRDDVFFDGGIRDKANFYWRDAGCRLPLFVDRRQKTITIRSAQMRGTPNNTTLTPPPPPPHPHTHPHYTR